MNKKELAEYFGVSANTITRWISLGCPYEKDERGRYIFDPGEVETWRQDNIDSRAGKEYLPHMTPQEAQKALTRIYDKLLPYVDWRRLEKDLNRAK